MMLLLMCTAEVSEESKEKQAEHIEGRHQRADHTDYPKQFVVFKYVGQDFIFGEKPCKWRNTCDCDRSDQECNKSDRQLFAQPAHIADILLVGHSVDHTTRAEEKQCFEECVGYYV